MKISAILGMLSAVAILSCSRSSDDAGIVLRVELNAPLRAADVTSLTVDVDGLKRVYPLAVSLPGSLGIVTSPGLKKVAVEGNSATGVVASGSDQIEAKKGEVVNLTIRLTCVGCTVGVPDGGADDASGMPDGGLGDARNTGGTGGSSGTGGTVPTGGVAGGAGAGGTAGASGAGGMAGSSGAGGTRTGGVSGGAGAGGTAGASGAGGTGGSSSAGGTRTGGVSGGAGAGGTAGASGAGGSGGLGGVAGGGASGRDGGAGSGGTDGGPTGGACIPDRTVALPSQNPGGAFNTTGPYCVLVRGAIESWGCSNIEGRTVKVNGIPVKCGDALPAPWPGTTADYYFEFSAGPLAYTSMYAWAPQ